MHVTIVERLDLLSLMKKKDVRRGYRQGDLAYWIPGGDFVIFTELEEDTDEVDRCVILRRLLEGLDTIRARDIPLE